jgi:hypothetical protein
MVVLGHCEERRRRVVGRRILLLIHRIRMVVPMTCLVREMGPKKLVRRVIP